MKIDIKKKVYKKSTYEDVIDTKFNEFGVINENNIEFVPNINEFFEYYNSLFFDIPKEGELNSHRFLINKSLEYVGIETNPLIEELRNEISVLKQELINSNKVIGDLTNHFSTLNEQIKTI